MNVFNHILLISTLVVLLIGDISSNSEPPLAAHNALFQSGGRGDSNENEAGSTDEIKSMSLNMNITDLYEICKNYNRSNPGLTSNQLGRILPQTGMSKKTRSDINLGLESSCLSFFNRDHIKHLLETHQRLSRENLTTSHPPLKFTKPSKMNVEKAKMLGKPMVTYSNVSLPTTAKEKSPPSDSTGVTKSSVVKSTDAAQIAAKSPILGTVLKSSPVRRESGELEKQMQAPELFPDNNSGPIQVVNETGSDPVSKPSPDIDPPNHFPNNPQYDLNNITRLQVNIIELMEQITHIVTHNSTVIHNTTDEHTTLNVIRVINELKENLDDWTRSVHGESVKVGRMEMLKRNLIKAKFYLMQSLMELPPHTDDSELTCKITSLFEEIRDWTKIDFGFFDISTLFEGGTVICNDTYDWECIKQQAESDMERRSFHLSRAAVLAICFLVLLVLSYAGLAFWRFFLERQYRSRQLVNNEDAEIYDAEPEAQPLEVRDEQL